MTFKQFLEKIRQYLWYYKKKERKGYISFAKELGVDKMTLYNFMQNRTSNLECEQLNRILEHFKIKLNPSQD